MIIIAIHPHLTAFFIVSVVKAVQELLQHKSVLLCWRLAYAQISSSNNSPWLSCLIRHWFIIRTKNYRLQGLRTKKHDMITVWLYACQLLCPLHKPYCTQHITFILTQYGGEWARDKTKFLLNKVVLQKVSYSPYEWVNQSSSKWFMAYAAN